VAESGSPVVFNCGSDRGGDERPRIGGGVTYIVARLQNGYLGVPTSSES
jgi:hypothetical protein